MRSIRFGKYKLEKDVRIMDDEKDQFYSIKNIFYSQDLKKNYGQMNSVIVTVGENISGDISNNIYEASINDEDKYILKKVHIYENEYGKCTIKMFKNEIKYQNKLVQYGLSDPVLFAYIESEKECGFLMKKYRYSLFDVLDDYHLDFEDKKVYLGKVRKMLETLAIEVKICHGNFQSCNIMVDENKELKLIDFEKAESLRKNKTKKDFDLDLFTKIGCKLVKTSEEVEIKLEEYWYNIINNCKNANK